MAPPVSQKSWGQTVQWLREQPDQLELILAGYYDDPLVNAATRYWQSEEWREIRKFLPNGVGAQALDVGAGRGIASFALAKDGFDVTALEPDCSDLVGAEAIRNLAREQNLRILISQESSERMPFADGSFDLVFGRAVLHHTKDLASTCEEIHRVLRPGGTFIAVREHVISRDQDLAKFLQLHPLHRYYGGEHAFRLRQYTEAIRNAGFTLNTVLAPLRSPINFSPNSLAGLQRKLAQQASLGFSPVAAFLRLLLRTRAGWAGLLPLLEVVDHRPGRLYSFIALKT
jgi:SAM-dependent methyltransferase